MANMEDDFQGSNAIFISKNQVEKGLGLAKGGQQQLQLIPERETRYYFSVSHNSHYSVCEIIVLPIKHDPYLNFFFLPTQRYTNCCDNAPEIKLKEQRQIIYDVYIRPVQWRFGDNCTKVNLPQNAPHSGICEDHLKLGLDYLQQTATATSLDTEEEATSAGASQTPSQHTDMSHESDSGEACSTITLPSRKRKTNSDVVDTVLKKLKKAAKVRNYEGYKDASNNYLSLCVDTRSGLPLLKTEKERDDFAVKLLKLGKKEDPVRPFIWANKQYSYSMRYLLRREKIIDSVKNADRLARTSMLINHIASIVCDTEPGCCCGVQVYNLFCRANHLLTNLEGDKSEQLEKATQIAKEIRKEIPVLSGPTMIFYPPAVIATLWNTDYSTICQNLHAECLALPGVNMEVVPIRYDESLYTFAVRFEKGCPLHSVQDDRAPILNAFSHITFALLDNFSYRNINSTGHQQGQQGIDRFDRHIDNIASQPHSIHEEASSTSATNHTTEIGPSRALWWQSNAEEPSGRNVGDPSVNRFFQDTNSETERVETFRSSQAENWPQGTPNTLRAPHDENPWLFTNDSCGGSGTQWWNRNMIPITMPNTEANTFGTSYDENLEPITNEPCNSLGTQWWNRNMLPGTMPNPGAIALPSYNCFN